MEAQVGIREYAQNGKGFSATLKGLYSDFQVHEICVDGKIIHLTTLNQLIHDQTRDTKLSIFIARQDQNASAQQLVQLYDQFVLFKENQTAMEAIIVLLEITKQSKVHSSSFMIAGPKNEIAEITSQLVTSIDHLNPINSVSDLNVKPKEAYGSFRVINKPLWLDLPEVNRFIIVLSNVIGDEDFIKVNHKSLNANGFINYYGTEHFGTRAHLIGKQLLLHKWKLAIDLILEEIHGQQKFNEIEAQLRSSMEKDDKNVVGALNTIPFSLRCTYILAYQSFIWNTIVSKRIATFGMTPIPGDLVYSPWVMGDSYDCDFSDSSKDKDPIQCQFMFVDQKNIHNYTIRDVVLPLPGYKVTYPINEIADWYRKLLLADGLSDMDFKRKPKKCRLNSRYRHLISKPSGLNWKFLLEKGSDQPHREFQEQLAQVGASAINQPKKDSSTFKSVSSAGKRKSISSPPVHFVKFEDDAKPMSHEEKRQLIVNIQLLPSDKLARVVHIFRSLEPVDGSDLEETVMNFDKLKPSTLRVLEFYVDSLRTMKSHETHDAKEVPDDEIGIASNSSPLSNPGADGDRLLVVEFNIPASSDVTMVVREIMKLDVTAMFNVGAGPSEYSTRISKSSEEPLRKGFTADLIVSEITSFNESPKRIMKKRLKLC